MQVSDGMLVPLFIVGKGTYPWLDCLPPTSRAEVVPATRLELHMIAVSVQLAAASTWIAMTNELHLRIRQKSSVGRRYAFKTLLATVVMNMSRLFYVPKVIQS